MAKAEIKIAKAGFVPKPETVRLSDLACMTRPVATLKIKAIQLAVLLPMRLSAKAKPLTRRTVIP